MSPEVDCLRAPPKLRKDGTPRKIRTDFSRKRKAKPQDHVRKSWVAASVDTQKKFLGMTALEINCWFWAARYATPNNFYEATACHAKVAADLGANVGSVGRAFRRLESAEIDLLEKIDGGIEGIASVYRVKGIEPFEDAPKTTKRG